MDKMLRAWLTEAKKLETGESTKEEYDDWRYKYPELDTHQIWAKVPSQELFDMLEKELKNTKKGEQTWKLIFEYYGAAEPLVRCGESHLSGLTEPLRSL